MTRRSLISRAGSLGLLALAGGLVACGGKSSPTAADEPVAIVVGLRAALNPAYSATVTIQAIATVTIEVRRGACGVVRFSERRDGRTLHLTVLPFEQIVACPQPAAVGQRFDLDYAILGPLASGQWIVEAGGLQASFTVP